MYSIDSKKVLKHLLSMEFQQGSFPCPFLGENTPLLLFRGEPPVLYVLSILPDDVEALPCWAENLTQYLNQQLPQLPQYCCTHLVSLSIVLGEQTMESITTFLDTQKEPMENRFHQVWWYATRGEKNFFAPKGHPTRLLNIEKALALALAEETHEEGTTSFAAIHQQAQALSSLPKKSHNAYLTMALFVGNLVLFLWMWMAKNQTPLFLQFGCDAMAIRTQHQWYRLVTALFLHNDAMHLMQNALYLFYFGNKLEILLGKGKFLTVYLLSGIGGGLLSIFVNPGLSIGSSGAVFGLIGGILSFSKYYGNRNIGMPYTSLLLFIVFGLLIGFLQPNVDTMAHIGGFITGALLTYGFLKTGDNSK